MKTLLFLSLMSFFLSPAFADSGIRLSCTLRKNVLISRFSYQLSTMKWPGHFQVASGEKTVHTAKNGIYTLTHFRNGDELVEYPGSHKYYLFYADKGGTPDRCVYQGAYSIPVTQLPIVSSGGAHGHHLAE